MPNLYTPRSARKVLQDLHAKLVSRTDLSDVNIGSTLHIIMNAIALEIASAESRLFEIKEGYSLLNASGEELDQRCSELPPVGVIRKQNVAASGSALKVKRDPASDLTLDLIIPAGSTVSRSISGLQYRTTRDAVIPANQTEVDSIPIVCSTPGSGGNSLEGEINTVVSMPDTVIEVTNTVALGNGLNRESDASLRQRALRFINSIGRVSKSQLEYLGTTYKSLNNSSFSFSSVYEDPTKPGYSELVVDDGTGLKNSRSLLITNNAYIVPAGGARFVTHDSPATAELTKDNISVTRSGVNVQLNADDFVSIPERGIIFFKSGVLQEDDQVVISGYRTYTGVIAELQRQIEGNPNASSISTGFRAAGCRVRVVPPTVTDFEVDVRIIVQQGFDREVIVTTVQNAVIDFINNLNIGQEVTSSRLITHLMITQPLASCNLYVKGTDTLFEAQYPASAKHVLRTKAASIAVTASL